MSTSSSSRTIVFWATSAIAKRAADFPKRILANRSRAWKTLTALLSFGLMRWVGLEWSTFWALLVFVLNFIPTLGPVIATVLPTAFALLQFDALTPPLLVCWA